jgi:hypothetical protein
LVGAIKNQPRFAAENLFVTINAITPVSDLKDTLLQAVMRLLEPLVRLLLEAGIGVGEVHQLLKKTYVQVAAKNCAGDPTISRIAALTGIPRDHVASLLQSSTEIPTVERGVQRAERVLRGWWSDPQFCDASGQPLILPLHGPRRSFAALVKRYAGDPRVRTLLQELLRVKAVRRLPDKRIEVLSRTFATARWDATSVSLVGERGRDLLETLTHNLRRPQQPRYTRFIVNCDVDPKFLPVLIRDLTIQAESFANRAEDALTDPNRTLHGVHPDLGSTRLGLGIFIVEEQPSTDQELEPPTKSRA